VSLFDRDGTESSGLAEPYASLLALLSDLHEQLELHPAQDEKAAAIIADVKDTIVRAALLLGIAAQS
jgi:hypothetical protein